MKSSDWWSLASNFILAVGLVVAFWQVRVAAKQARLAAEQMRSQLEWSRKEATFSYISRYRTDLRDTNLALQRRLDVLGRSRPVLNHEDYQELLRSDDVRMQLFEMVAYFEQLAQGVECGYLDEAIVRDSLAAVVETTYRRLEPYLAVRRSELGVNVGSSFEALARRWESQSRAARSVVTNEMLADDGKSLRVVGQE